MLHGDALGPLVGAVALGAIHGVEPGHGWPVAASYALDRTNRWVYGFAASLLLGVGHLVSSIAMVAAFFYAKEYFDLTQANEPITVLGGTRLGGPVSLVAGVLLVALGVREYVQGHSHGTRGRTDGHTHGDGGSGHHDHHEHSEDGSFEYAFVGMDDHDDSRSHDHGHAHDHDGGPLARPKRLLPVVGGHSHSHGSLDEAADRGLLGIAWVAFVLGFAHEEEFEIIALCAGSNDCLGLMGAYAVTVVVGIVGSTMLLIAGYQQYEEAVERYTPYLPAISATVLIVVGVGFVVGLF
jgi:ABC-type nickel/cobalt efflux system permease component RcnA